MTRILPALEIDHEKCDGRLACLRVCPTHAIRVRKAKVRIDALQCIDCGECILACPEGAIKPHADTWDDVESFPFKVAITSPTLFGQFPESVSPCDIIEGLKAIGFDAVYDASSEAELINMAIQDYLDEYKGPRPLISSICPVVVRLIQVSYPGMVGQLIPIEPPRELAGREMKRYFTEKEGIPPEDIGAIYLTPCPAKMASIKQPAENVKSHLDLALGINEVYNPLITAITRLKRDRNEAGTPASVAGIHSKEYFSLALTGGQSRALKLPRYITIAQLPNITRVFEDLEKGKLKDAEFLECYACSSGCIGGPLTVDDRFVARSKIQKYVRLIEANNLSIEDKVRKRYVKGDYFIRQPLSPRIRESAILNIREQIRRVKVKEELAAFLPGVDCGLCGSPTCETFAEDVAKHDAKLSDCVFVSPDRLSELRKLYNFDESLIPELESSED